MKANFLPRPSTETMMHRDCIRYTQQPINSTFGNGRSVYDPSVLVGNVDVVKIGSCYVALDNAALFVCRETKNMLFIPVNIRRDAPAREEAMRKMRGRGPRQTPPRIRNVTRS